MNRPVILTDPSGHKCVGEPEECLKDNGRPINGAGEKPKPKPGDDQVTDLETNDETNNPLIDIWNQDSDAMLEFFDNGCNHSLSGFLNTATCLDSASLISQDIATLFSSAGAAVTSATTLLGCIPASGVGCAAGYLVGVDIHVIFFNPYETIASGFSFATTAYSDWLTHDTYINNLHDWGVGEDTSTGFLTFLPGQITVDPLIDAGVDIYASGYNHGYFCGMSTILDCLR